jgi:hypothetical protein
MGSRSRNSGEYKAAYDSISEELAKIPKEKGVEECHRTQRKGSSTAVRTRS